MGGRVGLLALGFSILFSIGCGSSSSSNTGQVRILEAAVGAPPVNILVDGATVVGNLGYGSATAYLTVKSGSRHVQAVPVGGGSPVFVTVSSGKSCGKHRTQYWVGAPPAC